MRAAEARSVGLPAWPASRGAQTIADRVRAKLTQARVIEPDMPITVSFVDPWRQDVFLILARRCGLDPQQLAPDDWSTLIVFAPKTFYNQVLWPEFKAISYILEGRFTDMTLRAIEVVFDPKTSDKRR